MKQNDNTECKCGCHTEQYKNAPDYAKMKPVGCQHCTDTTEDWEEDFEAAFALYPTSGGINRGWLDENQLEIIKQFIRQQRQQAYKKGKLEAYENALLWTKQIQPDNMDALTAYGNAVDQMKYELASLKEKKE